jgi:hypothetical protein
MSLLRKSLYCNYLQQSSALSALILKASRAVRMQLTESEKMCLILVFDRSAGSDEMIAAV